MKKNNSIITVDNHKDDMSILLNKLNNIALKGVIHIGAHKGEEVDLYLEKGLNSIVLIEANPNLYKDLCDKFTIDQVKVYNYAIYNTESELKFYINESRSGSIEASSLFKMKEFSQIVPAMKTSAELIVKAITLDQFIEDNNIQLNLYNVLVLDIQGAEFFALEGAKNCIDSFDAVIVEVQCVELYENFISEAQIEELMEAYGFYRDYVVYHELHKDNVYFPAWGEVLYLKKK